MKNGKKRIVKVQCAIPNEGHTQPESYDNRLQMCFHLGMLQMASKHDIKEYAGVKFDIPDDVEFEFYWSSVGRILTPLARERLTEWALKTEMDYLFFIDDDMICPTNMFERLYKHQVDIVAPLAFMRLPPHYPVIYRLEEGYDNLSHCEYYVTHTIKNYPKDKLVECDAVGFGSCLIDMKVVRKMRPKYFMSTTASGEDLFFCRKAREVGAKVYMDTSIKLGHLGIPPIITEEDYEREFKTEQYRKENHEWDGIKKRDERLTEARTV